MSDKAYEGARSEMAITSVAESENFVKLSQESQVRIIDSINQNKEKESGFMGKIFGSRKDITAMNISFALCVLLAIIGCICSLCGNDYWNVIIPAITTGMGYMFGKGDK